MKKAALLALLVLSPLTASADVHKCIISGHTTFQDFPCSQGAAPRSNTGTLSTLPIPAPATRPIASRVYQPAQQFQRPSYNSRNNTYQSSTERRNAEVSAAARGIVLPGMTESQAIRILGQPSRRSTRTFGGNLCRYLYWDGSRPFQDGHHSVRICNGEVSSYSGN
ncbi:MULTISPECIES: hypothetical protein [Halomonadaceae]|uniref:hypothetical protein n=1 Tax=Halomonadaceae TaxID=28256 RepID=UPI0004E424CD|nr:MULTISPECIES: hypothetical protein [unclassified Halomonas]AJY52118.1 hypothetical protein KO116_03651 [Halomonas sp. KO116]WKV93625.1 hypothetical protein Q3Y66_03010 [Halomonas sp. HAL1]|tara:strand:+ start:173 stop:670 length:498 start_codon:yes stop_codon:yes gene_type:complete